MFYRRKFTICFLSCIIFILCNESDGQAFRISHGSDCGKVEEIEGDVRTKVPWTAAIFGRAGSKSPYQYTVTGTLIGPTTVLTLFGGAYGVPAGDFMKYFIPKPENYIVALGMKSNNLDEQNPFRQISRVTHIIPWRNHTDQNYYTFYILHLSNPVDLTTPYVKTACIPLFFKNLKIGPYGRNDEFRLAGFAVPPRSDGFKELKFINVAFEDSAELCEISYRLIYEGEYNHTFCGTHNDSRNGLVCLEPGSPIAVPILNSRWFVVGISALIPNSISRSWCHEKTRYFYGKLTSALDWISENTNCSPNFACSGGQCLSLSKVCDQKQDCPNADDEDPIYCRAKKPCIFGDKTHECGVYGKCISPQQICDGVRDCENGSDENESVHRICPARKAPPIANTMNSSPEQNFDDRINLNPNRGPVNSYCALLQASEGVEIDCQLSTGEDIPCSESQAGTFAIYKCKQYYRSISRSPTLSQTCSEDGSWRPARSFGCTPECGLISNGLSEYIYGGQDTSSENAFPWHGAIFRITPKSSEFQYICGASLIENNVILTAAHCVSQSNGAVVPKGQFRIVLGANSSSYDSSISTKTSQVFNAKDIFVPGTYDRRSLQSDIAIMVLDKSAVYGVNVRPVCYLERGSSIAPVTGSFGKVPGYGFREGNTISESLIFAEFPVISPDDCKMTLGRTPPLSTFCAGYMNGTSVCSGDSGSSMVFPSTATESVTKYFIRGIVSHGEAKQGLKCDINNYAVFTHVDSFADWILQRLDEIHK